MKPHVSIIIPARAESEVIISTLQSLSGVVVPHEIIVVSDLIDPMDTTEIIVRKYAHQVSGIRLVQKHIGTDKDGFAGALFRGVAEAKTPYIVFVMADLCDDPKTIDVMHAVIQKGWDVVCGSRYIRGGKKIGGPKIQGFFSWFVNSTLRIFTGLPTYDASNSFKMYRRTTLANIGIDQTMGVEASLELIFRAYGRGARITEVPTRWLGRTRGTSKFRLMKQLFRYGRIYYDALFVYRRKFSQHHS